MARSTKSAGKTAVAHARAWMSSIHPGSLVLEANKRVGRFPDTKDRAGNVLEWKNRTVEEDLFGVFDLAVFPVPYLDPLNRRSGLSLIQVTTISKSAGLTNVRTRLTKVGKWTRSQLGGNKPCWLEDIYVVGWMPRKHLRIWSWSWELRDLPVMETFGGWVEREPALAKLPKRVALHDASSGPPNSDPEMPF